MPVAVLLYHRVSRTRESASADPSRITVCAASFAEQAAALAERYRVLPLADALADAERLDADPRPTVAITFDDVYGETLEIAEPVLRRHGLPATLFVPVDHVGSAHGYWWDRLARRTAGDSAAFAAAGDRLMRLRSEEAEAAVPPPEGGVIPAEDRVADWAQLGGLDRDLFSFGCHGGRHHCFAAVPAGELRAELRHAADTLAASGLPYVRALAYPYGFEGCVTAEQVSAAVAPLFDWGLTTRRGLVGAGGDFDPYHVRRCYVEDWDAGRLDSELRAIFHPSPSTRPGP
jgi:peptidoglycan/xylan/chitin deacetylase (PgdA/CDA1 family)